MQVEQEQTIAGEIGAGDDFWTKTHKILAKCKKAKPSEDRRREFFQVAANIPYLPQELQDIVAKTRPLLEDVKHLTFHDQ